MMWLSSDWTPDILERRQGSYGCMVLLAVLTSSTVGMNTFVEMSQVTKHGRYKSPTISAVGRFCGQRTLEGLDKVMVGSRK
jgi:hypothetical protein